MYSAIVIASVRSHFFFKRCVNNSNSVENAAAYAFVEVKYNSLDEA